MKVVIPDPIDLPADAIERLKRLPATVYEDVPADEAELISRVKDAEVITANYVDLTRAVIDGALKLKYIVVPAVGYEWVDYEYAASKGIKVLNCPTNNSRAVAEHAVALMFAVARHLGDASTDLRAGNWDPNAFRGMELGGKQLGLVGNGNISQNIRPMADGLGMQVKSVNSKNSAEELDDLLRSSDVVVLCLPLNSHTKGIIDERRLALLKPTAILVNVARGGVVDQEALVKILHGRKIAGAGLDVFDGEPLIGKAPDHIVKIAGLPNVVATPHIAYNTPESATRLGAELFEDLKSCIDAKPINVVAG